jgi:hypothetical protein
LSDKGRVAASVGVEAATPLWYRHPRPGALVGGVGHRRGTHVGEPVDDSMLAGGAQVVRAPGSGGEIYASRPAGSAMTGLAKVA